MAKKRLKSPLGQTGKRFISPETATGSSQHRHPLFSLQHLSSTSPFGLSNCTREEKAAFADTLAKLSQMSWAAINQAPRHGLGYEKIDRTSIKTAIPGHLKEDVSFFLAFRFFGKAPMVGYRKEEVFHVLWLDREFKLYQHSG